VSFCLIYKAVPDFMPKFFNAMASGQKLVNDDCNKSAPTKTVNHNPLRECHIAKLTLNNMNIPAIASIQRSIVIFNA
jgi:hypothetical protein